MTVLTARSEAMDCPVELSGVHHGSTSLDHPRVRTTLSDARAGVRPDIVDFRAASRTATESVSQPTSTTATPPCGPLRRPAPSALGWLRATTVPAGPRRNVFSKAGEH